MNDAELQAEAFSSLVEEGHVSAVILADGRLAAKGRGVPLARVLHAEYGVARELLLKALGRHYGCKVMEYDERFPVPPELLRLAAASGNGGGRWFPVAQKVDGATEVAVADPSDPAIAGEVRKAMGGECSFTAALPDDISWFSQDLLHAPPGELIGTERTGLAYWRNTMAQWRTRMACYRTDLAKARTALSAGRAGLAFTTIAETLWRSSRFHVGAWLPWGLLAVGIALLLVVTPIYLKVRRSRMTPPGTQTLVEVTAATLMFLEGYHLPTPENHPQKPSKDTMLARLGDFLADYSTIIYPVPASRERTHLARERNVLAAQRTIAACYRTIYARARTGLAFIRTGASFISIGIGLLTYFGVGINTPFDLILMAIGAAMIVDGLLWYLPVRKEKADLPHSRSAALG